MIQLSLWKVKTFILKHKNNSGRFGIPLPLSALLMMTADGKDGWVKLKNWEASLSGTA